MDTAHCGACHSSIKHDYKHNCLEQLIMLHIIEWFHEGLEDTGHDLGHYFRKLQKNTPILKQYSEAVANDIRDRSAFHKQVCNILGADYSKFKPFESEQIWKLPSKEEAHYILWIAVIEHMWTYTTLHLKYNKSYKETWNYRLKYIGEHKTLKNIFDATLIHNLLKVSHE